MLQPEVWALVLASNGCLSSVTIHGGGVCLVAVLGPYRLSCPKELSQGLQLLKETFAGCSRSRRKVTRRLRRSLVCWAPRGGKLGFPENAWESCLCRKWTPRVLFFSGWPGDLGCVLSLSAMASASRCSRHAWFDGTSAGSVSCAGAEPRPREKG